MEANVVKIGNSHYVLLAKKMLEHYGISDKVEIEYKEEHIIIKPYSKPREGWEALYQESFATEGLEKPLIPGVFGDEELLEYED